MTGRPAGPGDNGHVRVRGAREHNLRDLDVDVPRNALVAFSGISGSGKSSLAFGTIFAEAQRRFFDSVAPYARRLIDQVGTPAVDAIDGLPPAIALHQQRGTPSVRSTIGSVTTISNLLRMLYSRAGHYPARAAMLHAEDFSPNTPQGACPECHGLGRLYDVTERAMVPDPSLSIREGAIASWPPAWHGQNLRDILVTLGHDIDRPWRELPAKDRRWILFTDEQPTVPVYAGFTPAEVRAALRRKAEPSYQGTFIGARKYVLQTFATTQSDLMRRRVSRFLSGKLCPACHGKRLKQAALAVKIAGLDIGELSQLPLVRVAEVLRPLAQPGCQPAARAPVAAAAAMAGKPAKTSREATLSETRSPEKALVAQRIGSDVVGRIEGLRALGLGYLSLERATPTLSPGELQRVRLATQIHSNLFGVVYVLDEPSAGLHPADAESLANAFDALKRAGNSVFVVEHHLGLLRRADWIIDLGPDAGERGGEVLYSGPPAGLPAVARSHTGRYLRSAPVPRRDSSRLAAHTRGPSDGQPEASARQRWLRLEGVVRNNLHRVDARFPIGALTTVTGVSGSGKSSLVSHELADRIQQYLEQHHGLAPEPADADEDGLPGDARSGGDGGGHAVLDVAGSRASPGRLSGDLDAIRRFVRVDQKPIGRTPRSNLATYTGFFDAIRKRFAETPAARARRYDAGRFSFNVAKGRCPHCEGEGFVMVELLFLPSVYAPCAECGGSRYNPATLEIRWRDMTIADVLRLTVDEATERFADEPAIHRPLTLLQGIGLGYLRLGQPATELSGGEAQRIKLATELQRMQRGRTLYILDEPTSGLHALDVDRFMVQLQALVDAGNTVVVVEHDMRVAAQSDWIIDMGPGAGDEGGRIIAEGSPAELARSRDSVTAPWLAEALRASADGSA